MAFAYGHDVTVYIMFEIGPGDDPNGGGVVKTDVSSLVREIHFRRGRQHELNRVEAGTCTLVLDNTSRDFEPGYASGSYYPNVKPLRWVQVEFNDNEYAEDYNIFTGLVQRWQPKYLTRAGSAPNRNAVVELEIVDGFLVLQLEKVSMTLAAGTSDTQIAAVLTEIGWHADNRDLDTGNSTLQAWEVANQSAMDVINTIAESEHGIFFFDVDGKAAFRNRQHRVTGSTYYWELLHGGLAKPSEIALRSPSLSYDEDHIYNEIVVKRQGGAAQTASDATSQSDYLLRELRRLDLQMATDAEALDQANWLLAQYKDPALRMESCEVPILQKAAAAQFMLKQDLSTHGKVTIGVPQGGVTGTLTFDVYLEGITVDITAVPKTINESLQLSNSASQSYWVLNSDTYGVLGDTTRVGY